MYRIGLGVRLLSLSISGWPVTFISSPVRSGKTSTLLPYLLNPPTWGDSVSMEFWNDRIDERSGSTRFEYEPSVGLINGGRPSLTHGRRVRWCWSTCVPLGSAAVSGQRSRHAVRIDLRPRRTVNWFLRRLMRQGWLVRRAQPTNLWPITLPVIDDGQHRSAATLPLLKLSLSRTIPRRPRGPQRSEWPGGDGRTIDVPTAAQGTGERQRLKPSQVIRVAVAIHSDARCRGMGDLAAQITGRHLRCSAHELSSRYSREHSSSPARSSTPVYRPAKLQRQALTWLAPARLTTKTWSTPQSLGQPYEADAAQPSTRLWPLAHMTRIRGATRMRCEVVAPLVQGRGLGHASCMKRRQANRMTAVDASRRG